MFAVDLHACDRAYVEADAEVDDEFDTNREAAEAGRHLCLVKGGEENSAGGNDDKAGE